MARAEGGKCEYLRPFVESEKQKQHLEAYIRHGSLKAAAKATGCAPNAIRQVVEALKIRAADAGQAPGSFLDMQLPAGQQLRGVTYYTDNDGNIVPRYIKTERQKEQELDQADDFAERFATIVSKHKPFQRIKAPKKNYKDTLASYFLGDPHVGMYSWSRETGSDFDCDIAEANLKEAMFTLVDKMPPAETAIVLNLGDFFHSDNQSNRTARAGNALDVDTRWSRVLEIGIELMVTCVEMALEKHKNVIIKNNIGNHDDHTSQVLSICLSWAFKKNPRVTVASPMDSFFAYEFGKTSIFSTHGHMVKPAKMQGVVSNYWPEIWGRTEHRYAHFGHFHHKEIFEDNGLVTEIHNTLAASDAWHHASGYKSKRSMDAVLYHREYGQEERYTFNINR